ncbi:hypothetical protein DTL70_05370 [Streptomyces diacarni]|uniref:Uncharacterized protein n=1 Tax=Streptomyces diacarni TaxID=2800381 RepID=A0A367FBN1_9ACTN|nr:hypothetical protein [Streptomyces diacarni]RCG27744.1 hypothetical protein DTL70_05370 [Streptomyces diacarni]
MTTPSASSNSSSHVADARGPLHTGPGDQNIYYGLYYGDIGASASSDRSGRDPRQVAVEELRSLRRRFVDPAGSERARELLEDKRAVMLTAGRGDGARTAAKVFLCQLPQGSRRFRELVDQAEEGDSAGRALDREQVERGAALLLDLSTVPSRRYETFMAELPWFLKVVRECDAWLAVVLPVQWRAGFEHVFRGLVVGLGRPDPAAVLQAHLRDGGIRVRRAEVAVPELEHELRTATMAQTADLSEDIRAARDAAPPDSGFAAWLKTALAAHAPGAQDVEAHLSGLDSGAQRALLLTTALLHGARTDTVHEATVRLARAVEHPEVATPLLHHRTLTARLTEIKAAAHQGRVRFTVAGYDAGVRRWFWDNYPQLRGPLADWLRAAPGFTALERAERLELVTRFAHERLRTGPPDGLAALAERWSRPSASPEELTMAARALGEGVVHARYGSHFRQQLYRWAQDSALPAHRAHVVIGVCSEVLSRRFPDQAMIRLRHVSRHQEKGVRVTAREALARITDSDDRLYRSLLRRLTPGAEPRGLRDLGIFLHVADAARMTGDATVGPLLADHWTAALAHLPPSRWQQPLRAWLERAHTRPAVRRAALRVLATACARQRAAFGAVYAAACSWAAGDAARQHTVNALWEAAGSVPRPHPSHTPAAAR